jgi:hypothetical protein
MSLGRVMGSKNQKYNMRLTLSNGEYIDQGVLELNLLLVADKLKS